MLALVVAAIAMGYIPNKSLAKKMRLAIPLIALVFVGFYTNSSVSIGSLAAIVMGYIPEPTAHPIWWIMMVSIFAGIIFLGQNIYCNKLCPFSTVQMLLNKITGMNLKVHPKIAKNSALIIKLMIWFSLMLIFLSRHPAMGSYEPFSMMFSLEGMGMQWYILPFSLLGSLFVSDFWCRYFCPVGYSLNEMVRWRRTGMRKVKARFDKPSQAIKVKNITSDSK